MNKKTLTIKGVANQFKIHPNTIRNWIKQGVISPPQRAWNERMIFSKKNLTEISRIQIQHKEMFLKKIKAAQRQLALKFAQQLKSIEGEILSLKNLARDLLDN